jgi:hypothetical protein
VTNDPEQFDYVWYADSKESSDRKEMKSKESERRE